MRATWSPGLVGQPTLRTIQTLSIMIFSIFRKRNRGVYSNKQFKELLAVIKRGGRPPLIGIGITKAQAGKIKEVLAGADDLYYRCCVESHIVAK